MQTERSDIEKKFHAMKDDLLTRLQNACSQRDEARAQVWGGEGEGTEAPLRRKRGRGSQRQHSVPVAALEGMFQPRSHITLVSATVFTFICPCSNSIKPCPYQVLELQAEMEKLKDAMSVKERQLQVRKEVWAGGS